MSRFSMCIYFSVRRVRSSFCAHRIVSDSENVLNGNAMSASSRLSALNLVAELLRKVNVSSAFTIFTLISLSTAYFHPQSPWSHLTRLEFIFILLKLTLKPTFRILSLIHYDFCVLFAFLVCT